MRPPLRSATPTLALSAPTQVVLGQAAYSQRILADTPALYWRLGESAGTNADDETANNRDGTYNGGFTLAVAGAIAGDSNSAVDLQTNGDVRSSYSPFVTSSTRSFEGWAKRDTSASAQALIGGIGAVPPFLRLAPGTNNVNWYPEAGAGSSANWAAVWPGDGVWVHWVLVYNDSTLSSTLYINGVSAGTTAAPNGYGVGSGAVTFNAGLWNGGDWFDGQMDEVAVYEYGLTAAQVLAHYNVSAAGLSAATLALGVPVPVPLATGAAQSAATLALSAPTRVTLATSAAQSAATLSLAAPTRVVLGTSAAVSSATLALSAPTRVPLATAACVASATCR